MRISLPWGEANSIRAVKLASSDQKPAPVARTNDPQNFEATPAAGLNR
jgi:hypothetical protein